MLPVAGERTAAALLAVETPVRDGHVHLRRPGGGLAALLRLPVLLLRENLVSGRRRVLFGGGRFLRRHCRRLEEDEFLLAVAVGSLAAAGGDEVAEAP